MYKIKQIPEDFYVKEIIDLEFTNSGDYSYYLLKKINETTLNAIERISKTLRIQTKNIGFSGMKDKRGITEQAISIFKGPPKDYELSNIVLKFLGYGKERINLGAHRENYFEIVVRNIDERPKKIKTIINYFDDQRFSEKNKEIGKKIILGHFEDALKLILETTKQNNLIRLHLEKNPRDYIGAILRLPKRILRIYINVYQAYLWNKTAEEYLNKKNKVLNIKIPIIGFATEFGNDEVSRIILNIMKNEKITTRNFIIKQIPWLSSEGSMRDLIVKIKGLKIGKLEEDELNENKKRVKVEFTLPKGSYATTAIKQLFF